jgi:hypothetical protein
VIQAKSCSFKQSNRIRTNDDATSEAVMIENEQGEELATIAPKDALPDAMKN